MKLFQSNSEAKFWFLGLWVFCNPIVANANDSAEKRDITEGLLERQNAEGSRLVSSGGPLNRSASGSSNISGVRVADFELSSSEDTVSANISFSLTRNHSEHEQLDSGDYQFRTSSDRFSLKGSVPINGSDGVQFADFGHIGDDAKITLGFTSFKTSHLDGKSVHSAANAATLACLKKVYDDNIDDVPAPKTAQYGINAKAFVNDFKDKLDSAPPITVGNTLVQIVANQTTGGSPKYGQFSADASSQCFYSANPTSVLGNELTLLSAYGPAALGETSYPELNEQILGKSSIWFIGAEATIGYEKFDILNRTAFSADQIDRVGFDGSAYIGWILPNSGMSIRGSAGYARGYKAEDEIEFCRMAFGTVEQECIKAQDGNPDRKNTGYAKLEARLVLAKSESGTPSIAIAPEASYVFEDKEFVFDVPIYFQRNSEGGLDGGLRLGYRTGKNDFGVGVFVGIPFANWFSN